MTEITFIAGRTSTGFDAYYEENEKIIALTTGNTMIDLKANALEAYNLYADHTGKQMITVEQIVFLTLAEIRNYL